MIISSRHRSLVLSLLATAAWSVDPASAFAPPRPRHTGRITRAQSLRQYHHDSFLANTNAILGSNLARRRFGSPTSLRMATEDFNEAKYTEAAWSSIAALAKVADYYQASKVEAPFLLDSLLNPGKHGTGDENAASAKKAVEKVLQAAGVDVKDLRKELEKYFSTQAKIDGGSEQKSLGSYLQRSLESARTVVSVLGVSLSYPWLQNFEATI